AVEVEVEQHDVVTHGVRHRPGGRQRRDRVDATDAIVGLESEGQDVGEDPVVVDDQDREVVIRVLAAGVLVQGRVTGRSGHVFSPRRVGGGAGARATAA